VRYQLKTPYNNGTTHVVFEPLDFLAKLAALVPRPRVNLTRYHGVFAPNSAHRALVTRAGRGKGRAEAAKAEARTPAEQRSAMTWAKRLKRVFGIDIETCTACGGPGCHQAGRRRGWRLANAFHAALPIQPHFPLMPWA